VGLLLSGCGTRASDEEVRAGTENTTPVTLTQESLDRFRSTGQGAVAGPVAAALDTPTGVGPTDVAPGTANAPGAATANRGAGAVGSKGQGQPAARAAADGPCTTPLEPVALGQVGTFSGVAAPISAATRTAAAVWAQDVNARGGLACHPVTLFSVDDGGDGARAAALVQQLQAEKRVIALVANSVVFSVTGFRSAIEKVKLPAVGGDLVGPDWHESPYMFAQGASIFDQILGFLRQGSEMGKKKVGALYCVELSACSEGLAYAKAGGDKRAGVELVYESAISVTQPDFTAQCQNAKNAGVDQLVLGMDGSSMIRVARSCAALGYRPLLTGVGQSISLGQSTDANLRSFGLAVASGVAPWTEDDTPGVKAYRAAPARYAPSLQPDGSSISGWTAGKLMEAAIAGVAAKARSGPLTTALVMEGLGTIKNQDLGGLTAALTFTPDQKASKSSGCIFYELLGTGGWTAPRGSRKVCV
jgi:branched-chain amino acid transport system substrate-binding protein